VPPLLFITGTDTGVGKTLLTALLLEHLRALGVRALAIKPFAAGDLGDTRLLHRVKEANSNWKRSLRSRLPGR
jgi:dethiobiotin synthetase